MLKSLISQRLEAKAAPLNLSPDARRLAPFFMNGRLVAYDQNLQTYIDKGYSMNDIVYSIIELIARKAEVAPWGMYKIKNESAYKRFNASIKTFGKKSTDFKALIDLQQKALEPVGDSGKWGELMKYPNQRDCMSEYVGNAVRWGLMTGNIYLYGTRLSMGANEGVPNELLHLPPQLTSIVASDTFPTRAMGYFLNYIPNKMFPIEDIAHIANFNPDYGVNGPELYGVAPLRAARMRLQKNNSSVKAEASSFDNEGIKALIALRNEIGQSPGDEEVEKAVATMAEMMRTQWSGVKNRGRIGVSGHSVDVHNIGMTNEEMGFTDSAMMDLRFLCNVFGGVPSRLLNDPENQAEANIEEAERALTSRCTLPHLVRLRNTLNRKGETDWNMKGMVCDFDMSVYTELAADAKEVGEYTQNLIVAIPNEQREQMGNAAIADERFNKPHIKQGGNWVPYDEAMMENEVDQALNDESEENI